MPQLISLKMELSQNSNCLTRNYTIEERNGDKAFKFIVSLKANLLVKKEMKRLKRKNRLKMKESKRSSKKILIYFN